MSKRRISRQQRWRIEKIQAERSARAQRATPARSAAYGDAKKAYFGPFGPDFVKRIEPSSVGANAQKTRLFEFSILVPVPHRPSLPLRL